MVASSSVFSGTRVPYVPGCGGGADTKALLVATFTSSDATVTAGVRTAGNPSQAGLFVNPLEEKNGSESDDSLGYSLDYSQ